MPGTCGYAAVWQVREALGRPRLPAIAASAAALPEPGDTAALDFAAFLLKPIEQESLCAALGACLGLTWLLADAVGAPATPVPHETAAPAPAALDCAAEPRPPSIELDAAREFAEGQDWDSLRAWCAELGDAFPECADFARRLHALLGDIDAGADANTAAGALRRLLADPASGPGARGWQRR